MARLSGVDLPREKRLEIALTYIYGIGRTRAAETLAATGVSGDTRVHALSEDDLQKLREWIDANYQVEGDLRSPSQPLCILWGAPSHTLDARYARRGRYTGVGRIKSNTQVIRAPQTV